MIPIDVRRDRRRYPGTIDDKLSVFNRIHGDPTAQDTYANYFPFYVIDNNDATFWVSATAFPGNPWIQLGLGVPRTVAKLRFYQGYVNGLATQFKIEVSNDNGASWYLAHTTPAGLGIGEYICYFPLLRYAAWRATALAGGAGFGWNVGSFELFGAVI